MTLDVVTGEIVPASRSRDSFGILDSAVRLAEVIFKTEVVPPPIRNRVDAVVAVILYGYELGLGPMQSLQSVDMIQGSPALSAEGKRALIAAAGHILLLDTTDTAATARCHRKEWPPDLWTEYTFTMADAERAALSGKDNWTKYPRAMLAARVTSEASRATFADVIGGLSYTPEELETVPSFDLPADEQPNVVLCAIDGADELTAEIGAEPERIRFAFRDWRHAKRYEMPPASPEILREMEQELARIRKEDARDSYEPPVGSPID